MRRAALAFLSTVTGLVFLLSFKSHTSSGARPAAIGAAGTGGTDTGGSSDTGGGSTPSSSGSSSSSSSSSAASSGSSRTVTGDSVDTRWGPVQVQITVRGGKITNVAVVDYPNGNPRDQEINSYAIPQLNQEVLAAQSGKIDTISGATVTSDGYIGSLQSALDKAGL
ncbi:MAG TPA: FMN-binding protein [Jatrophihabitans sp.]|jgi:uncharacterized protein with FMN-binding domain|nr:FMN-binding protein [Jatrophihabitans sp.]